MTVDTQGRVHTFREQRRLILAEFERNRMSAARFAQRTVLKYSTLAGWVQRYRWTKRPNRKTPVRLLEPLRIGWCEVTNNEMTDVDMRTVLLLLLTFGVAVASTDGATIDFEGIAKPNNFVEGSSIVIDGVSFVSTKRLFVLSSNVSNVGIDRVDNGTDYLFFDTVAFDGSQTLTVSDNLGRPFMVSSFDAVEANRALPGGFTITAVGSVLGGGTVSKSFFTAPHSSGELGVFQNFAFSPNFTGLETLVLSVSPITAYGELAIDNLQLAVVPEPTPLQLLFVGTAFWFLIQSGRRRLQPGST